MAEFAALSPAQQEQVIQPFGEVSQSLKQHRLIAVIRDSLRRFEESDYQRLLSQMAAWVPIPPAAPKPAPATDGAKKPDRSRPVPPDKPEPLFEYVPSRTVRVSFDKAWLADETDVDRYLESMREALMEEIRKGKRIQI